MIRSLAPARVAAVANEMRRLQRFQREVAAAEAAEAAAASGGGAAVPPPPPPPRRTYPPPTDPAFLAAAQASAQVDLDVPPIRGWKGLEHDTALLAVDPGAASALEAAAAASAATANKNNHPHQQSYDPFSLPDVARSLAASLQATAAASGLTQQQWNGFARQRVEALAALEADERARDATPTAFTQEHARARLEHEVTTNESVEWAAPQPRLPEPVAGWR